jgi:epoxyqueuosine reductase
MQNMIDMEKYGIEYSDVIKYEDCEIINERLTAKYFTAKKPVSVIVFLVPYYSGLHPARNISLYAVPRDYHLFFRTIFNEIETELKARYPANIFKGFADHSPINEVNAASLANLGVIGDNGLLINEKYGSFVFIGEIITDLATDIQTAEITSGCNHCGKCRAACPSPRSCLSAVTQKKKDLTESEHRLIKESGIAWGCDICQIVCPMNINIPKTPINFFRENLIPTIENGCDITDRAYQWRGDDCINRNIKIINGEL